MIQTKSALKFAVLPANEALTCLLDNRTGEHPVKDAPQCLIMRQIRDYKKFAVSVFDYCELEENVKIDIWD